MRFRTRYVLDILITIILDALVRQIRRCSIYRPLHNHQIQLFFTSFFLTSTLEVFRVDFIASFRSWRNKQLAFVFCSHSVEPVSFMFIPRFGLTVTGNYSAATYRRFNCVSILNEARRSSFHLLAQFCCRKSRETRRLGVCTCPGSWLHRSRVCCAGSENTGLEYRGLQSDRNVDWPWLSAGSFQKLTGYALREDVTHSSRPGPFFFLFNAAVFFSKRGYSCTRMRYEIPHNCGVPSGKTSSSSTKFDDARLYPKKK